MCSYWKRPSRQEDELTLAQIERGLERVCAYGCRFVNFTGGEPTLRDDLEPIVARASRLGMWTSMVTNGSLLTRERVRGLREAGLDNLLVSLDSTSAADHDGQRGTAGSFEQVEACTRWIREEFLRGHRTGGVMCVISRRNSAELGQLLRFARERGIFLLVQPYHANKTGDAEQVPAIGETEIAQLLSLGRRPRTVLNSRGYLLGMNHSHERASHAPCHAGLKYFSIDPFGYLHPCVDTPAIGHLLTDDITMVRSRAAQELVERCRGCWYCFRGEVESGLSLAGCIATFGLGLSVLWHNAALRLPGRVSPTRSAADVAPASRTRGTTRPGFFEGSGA